VTEGIRLQKVLAQAGVASRRRCEELMVSGRVEVNGDTSLKLGMRVDPATAVIRVDGKRLPPSSDHAYLVLNKPRGVVSTMADEQGRPDLAQYVAEREDRLFHVGRLDTETSGLLILTNDGDLAHKLAHPSFEIAKTYVALVDGSVKDSLGQTLKAGIMLEDGVVSVDRFRVLDRSNGRSLVELDIHVGRNKIVRRMLAAAGHPVRELTRTTFGTIHLGGMKPGRVRDLTRDERGKLFDSVGL